MAQNITALTMPLCAELHGFLNINYLVILSVINNLKLLWGCKLSAHSELSRTLIDKT